MSFRNITEDQIKGMLNLASANETPGNSVKKVQFSQLDPQPVEEVKEDISFLNNVELDLEVELGDTLLKLREVINLREGQVITLNRIVGDTVDLKANNNWLAYGEILVLNEVLAIRISSFIKEEESTRSVK